MIPSFEYQARTLNNSTYGKLWFQLGIEIFILTACHVLDFWSLIQHKLTPRRKSRRLILMGSYSTIPLQHAAPTVDTLASILLVFALLMERLLHWLCNFRAPYVSSEVYNKNQLINQPSSYSSSTNGHIEGMPHVQTDPYPLLIGELPVLTLFMLNSYFWWWNHVESPILDG